MINSMRLLLLFLLALPRVALAYLDPGTGSYVIQMILASFFLISFTFKTFWRRVFDFLKRLFVREKE